MTPIEIINSRKGQMLEKFHSTFSEWLKGIAVSARPGFASFQYTVRHDWLNVIGNLHGGVSAGIFDDMCGAAIYTLDLPSFFTTINNMIDYLAPAREGEVIIAEATVVKNGKQFINVDCIIWNADHSKMIVKGSSVLFKTNLSRK